MVHPLGLSARDPFWLVADSKLRAEVREALSKLQALYDAGNPFFTKRAHKHVYQQLKGADEKRKEITVLALDGEMVDFEIQTGTVLEEDDTELESVLHEPVVRCIPSPLLIEPFFVQPHLVYCNLQISHELQIRNKSTKEIIQAPIRPYEEVAKHFRESQVAWIAIETCKQLTSTILSAKTSLDITKIVAFACGPMTDVKHRRRTERSLFQHALLLTVREVLNSKNGTDGRITCYAQDPAYADVDKLVLEESGISVLDHPEAFLEVDDSTVVFCAAPDVPVREIVSDIARPAMMIWDDIKVSPKADPVSPRLRSMVQDMYDEFEFPDDSDDHFGKLAIYVRRMPTD